MRSNCIVYAVAIYFRRRSKGHEGYIALRRSRWGPFPHLLYVERRKSGSWRLVSYKPRDPSPHFCPPVIFDGKPRMDD